MKVFLGILAILWFGCSTVTMPSVTPSNGSIHGRLWLVSSEPTTGGAERISAENGDSVYITHCDEVGGWAFHNVPAGTYRLRFERDSFSSAQIVGFQYTGNGTAVIPGFSLLRLSVPDTLDSVATRVDVNGYLGYAFFVHGGSSAVLAFDRDSSALADWVSEAEYVDWELLSAQNEFRVPIIWNFQVRKYAQPIRPGDPFFIAVGEGSNPSWLSPRDPLPSGRFSTMPFARPVRIVRLQYNGAQ